METLIYDVGFLFIGNKKSEKKMSSFKNWLDTFVEEKELNTERVFEFNFNDTWNYMPLEVVLEFIKKLPNDQKAQIKDTIVKIDFHNGNVYHYFEYLAKGIVSCGGN